MPRNLLKRPRIPINIQRPQIRIAILVYLGFEELREIRRGSKVLAFTSLIQPRLRLTVRRYRGTRETE